MDNWWFVMVLENRLLAQEGGRNHTGGAGGRDHTADKPWIRGSHVSGKCEEGSK